VCYSCPRIPPGQTQCIYKGPFAGFFPDAPIDEAAYIASRYRFTDGTSSISWAEHLDNLRR
jgi:hypothetical protein